MKRRTFASFLLPVSFCAVMTFGTVPLPTVQATETSVTSNTDAELAGEGDYHNVHWKVSSDGLLTIAPKDGLTTAILEDFYEVTENPDPYAQDHEVIAISPTPWGNYSITDVIIADGITFVGGYAFYQNTDIQTVYLADSVKSIGTHAFTDTNVSQVHFSENLISIGEAAFQNTDLTEIVLPTGLTSFAKSAFQNCENLKSVTANGLTSIPTNAFDGCSNLTAFHFSDTLQTIGASAFCDCVSLQEAVLPDSVTALGAGTFQNCTGLTTVQLSQNLTEIPQNCFYGCTALTSPICLGKNITEIGNSAFANCTSLTYLSLGENLNELAVKSCFSGCNALETVVILNPAMQMPISQEFGNSDKTDFTIYGYADSTAQAYAEKFGISFSVYGELSESKYRFDDNLYWTVADGILIISGEGVMPDYTFGNSDTTPPWYLYATEITAVQVEEGITHIGSKSFAQLENLQTVALPKTLTSIGEAAFQQSKVTSVVIPNSVTELGEAVFKDCTALSQLEWSNLLTEIPNSLCVGCSELTALTLPESIKRIGKSAFSYCTNLQSVAFPNKLQKIDDFAFYQCVSLSEAEMGNHLSVIGGGAFRMCSGLKTISLGSNLDEIRADAFEQSGLTGNVTIPATVSKIGNNAFLDCPNITSYTVKNASLSLNATQMGYVSGESDYEAISTTFYGFTGSQTQMYTYKDSTFTFSALEESFEKGDVNLDGTISVADVILLQRYLLGRKDLQSKQAEPADVFADGCVNGLDLAVLRRMLQI